MTVTSSESYRSNTISQRPAQKAAVQRSPKLIEKVDLKHLPPGMNPALAKKVRNIGLTTEPKL